MKSDAIFEQERDEYYDEAELETNSDWVLWDNETNSDALLALWHLLNMSGEEFDGPFDRIAQAKDIIREVMWNAAKGHARQVILNHEWD